MINHFIDIQMKLPPNRTKTPKYRDLGIKNLVDLNLREKETQTLENINRKLTKLSTFANWGVKQGLVSSNPFSLDYSSAANNKDCKHLYITDIIQ